MAGVKRGEATGAYVWNYKKDGSCFLNRLRVWPVRAFCVARIGEVRVPLVEETVEETVDDSRIALRGEATSKRERSDELVEKATEACRRITIEPPTSPMVKRPRVHAGLDTTQWLRMSGDAEDMV
tara:strand:+ start:9337 stop:9711 length:375 start_codon:yes stop_codon:yes gene_type:complete